MTDNRHDPVVRDENGDAVVAPVDPDQTVHHDAVDRGAERENVVVLDDRSEPGDLVVQDEVLTREGIVSREKEEFGGMKFGTAFFGWLTATGTAVILTALVAGAGAAVGLTGSTPEEAADDAAQNADTIGIVGAIAVLVVLFVAYFCGGYVAGRMSRFSGAKQGVAVWLWAIIVAVVLAIVAAIAGSQFNILSNLNSFPRIPINEGTLTVAGIITVVAAVAVALVGAIIGGLAGMRFHRRVDRVGFGPTATSHSVTPPENPSGGATFG